MYKYETDYEFMNILTEKNQSHKKILSSKYKHTHNTSRVQLFPQTFRGKGRALNQTLFLI